jgi:hypothetical protein
VRSKWFLALFMAALLVLAPACGGSDDSGGDAAQESGQEQEGEQDEAPEAPGLEDVPEVVAQVNGEELTKDEFATMYEAQYQQMAAQAQSTGNEVGEKQQQQLRSQVAESMVTTELLLQEAETRDITASDAEVKQTLQGVAQQNGMQDVDALLAAMEEQGMDREEVDAQVRTQIKIAGLVEDEAGDVEPTDQEVRAKYDEIVAQQEAAGQQGGQQGEVPPLKEIRPQIVQQIKSDEQTKVGEALVEELRGSGDVEVFV